MSFLLRVIVNALALAAAVWVVPGINVIPAEDTTFSRVIAYLVVALVFGLVNALIRPVIAFLSLPLTCLTLGIFTIIINAGMLMLTAWLTQFLPVGLSINAFWWDAIWGTIIVSIVSAILGRFALIER
ncbi:phage holin family protein [Glutamicibacter creatinolyticus]|uniref:phage holin family protein n=1 Tax=Glutamicibacter creatinolyticus TaxID=162496 RepID=UPI0037BF6EBF